MKKLLFAAFILLTACSESKEKDIIKKCIAAHGGDAYQELHASFKFRDMSYEIENNHGLYAYTRYQKDSSGLTVKDILTNEGFQRFVDNQAVSLPDSMVSKYSQSVNSVAYFFLLPFGLEQENVWKTYKGETIIGSQKYHEIHVAFDPEKGGVDHQDEYIFWINTESYTLDYFAYNYETNGGGSRLREATKRHNIKGFIFQDYNNYGLETKEVKLSTLPSILNRGDLPLLSTIENENIKVW